MSNFTLDATLISSTTELQAFVSSISSSSKLYLDLEGNSLCRHGTISLITILDHPLGVVRIIDVLSLGKSSFTAASNGGKSLKSILEDPSITKYFWDVRNDADALWALYQVGLAGVVDIQLMENATRTGDKTYLHGLNKAIQSDLPLGFRERSNWLRLKTEIRNRMSGDIFSVRPAAKNTIQYCANDVIHLPALYSLYSGRISDDWLAKVKEESLHRVIEAHSPTYEPQSSKKALGPWGPGTARHISLEDMLEEWEDKRIEDLSRDLYGGDEDDEYFYEDDGPTSCRDIINDEDYHLYYSD